MTTINDIMKVEGQFYASLGNGKAALEHAATMINAVVTSRDTTVLRKAIKRAGQKGDDRAVQALKLIIRNVWPGASYSKDGEIKIKGIRADSDAVDTMNTLVSDGVSLRGTLLQQAYKSATVKEFDVQVWAKRMHKAHGDELEAMIAALQALRS